ncbi:MAG: hypothetical protein MZW92_64375 [Comamonadaceae bacterium]|nr:hypothetical protein [Comamonadaceae bacterium]
MAAILFTSISSLREHHQPRRGDLDGGARHHAGHPRSAPRWAQCWRGRCRPGRWRSSSPPSCCSSRCR